MANKSRSGGCGFCARPGLSNKRGFATLFLLVLGAVLFIFAASMAYFIQSENDQAIDTANSYTGESRLNFMGQSIQADFFNNLLQSEFERIVAEFLEGRVHIIDPQKSFRQNLGGAMEGYLAEEAAGIVSGDASHVYAQAYSAMPQIRCSAEEVTGASADASVKESEDGSLSVDLLSIGQSLRCKDLENDDSVEIDLRAKGYVLSSRAVRIHEEAVATIQRTKDILDQTEGVARIASGWRLHDDSEVRSDILRGPQGWVSQTGALGLLMSLGGTDGISANPLSIKIRNGHDEPFNIDDIAFSCKGDAGTADSGGPQTCRPDTLSIHIAEDPEGEKKIPIDFERADESDESLEITIIEAGIEISLPIDLGDRIGSLLGDITAPLESGYIDYGGPVTHLCNLFVGRAKNAVIAGEIVESDKTRLPGDYERLIFSFKSTSQDLDTEELGQEIDCSDHDDIVRTNAFDLLTAGGKTPLEIIISQANGDDAGMQIDPQSLNEIQHTINQNPMLRTGENKQITLSASVEGEEFQVGQTSANTPDAITESEATNVRVLNEGEASEDDIEQSDELMLMQSAFAHGDADQRFLSTMNVIDSASSSLSSAGFTSDAESLARTSSAVCKIAGFRNWADLGDNLRAALAICGIAKIGGGEHADIICSVAGLYQAVDSGSAYAIVGALEGLLAQAGYDVNIPIEQIRAAIESGDIEKILLSAASYLRIDGLDAAADLLAQVLSVVENIDGDAALMAAGAIFAMLGDSELAETFASLYNLAQALDGADLESALRAISAAAKSLGLSGMAELEGFVGAGYGIYEAIMNIDELLANCEGKIPWGMACLSPSVGGIVCDENLKVDTSCQFSYSLPSFEIDKICRDIVFEFGFQIDCTCMYVCPDLGMPIPVPKSVRVDLNQLMLIMNPEQYLDMFNDIDLSALIDASGLLNYCRLDP